MWSPELQARVEKEWSDLFRDVEAALTEDPASATAQALVGRWMELVRGFTGGDAQITEGVKELYNDRPNWPAGFQQKMVPFTNPKVWDFIHKANAVKDR